MIGEREGGYQSPQQKSTKMPSKVEFRVLAGRLYIAYELYYRVGQKAGHRLITIILSNLNQFKKCTVRFVSEFAVKWTLKIPPHLAYVATLPCETSCVYYVCAAFLAK